MRLTKIKVVEILTSIIGEDGIPLIEQLLGKDNISEFDLATKTKKDIKIVRRMLYLLYNHNLVSFTRKKDKQKGWYIYFFTFDKRQADEVVLQLKKERISRFQQKLEREKKHEYYLCPERCTRVSIENAMENGFMCLECGQLLGPDPNTDRTIKRMEKEIDDLSKTVAGIEEQRKKDLEIIKEKQLKKEAKKQPKKKVQQKPKNKPKPVKKVKHSKKSKKKKR